MHYGFHQDVSGVFTTLEWRSPSGESKADQKSLERVSSKGRFLQNFLVRSWFFTTKSTVCCMFDLKQGQWINTFQKTKNCPKLEISKQPAARVARTGALWPMPNCTCGGNTSQHQSFLGFLWIAMDCLPSSQVKFTRRDMTCFFHECLMSSWWPLWLWKMPRHWQLRRHKVSD